MKFAQLVNDIGYEMFSGFPRNIVKIWHEITGVSFEIW